MNKVGVHLLKKFTSFLPAFGRKSTEQESLPAASQFKSLEELLSGFLLIFLLVVIVIVSSLGVVMSAFEYRQLFNHHQTLLKQRDEFQVEWGQLLLEQSAWAANNRVEQQAIRVLNMQVPGLEQIEVVRNER